MALSLLSLILMVSFDMGPTVGALVPVQDEGDPWRTSFVFGVKTRYGMSFADVESELLFTELGIDPDSSRGFDYSMVPLTLGLSRHIAGLRMGLGAAVYSIKAELKVDDGFSSVWEGTYPGMYISLGRGFPLLSGVADLSAKFNIVDFNALWIGLTGSLLL
ncbi:MAG: hypothetical protein JXA64_04705 [Candidatus Fermentibacteraceae bacterium]|nr:hypothetical protein [Candidatus Fermentibacteraceae bacterium]MBN2608394.1 hypothetical protein [Candidatus Fermentibacteraceae bacterium]